MGVSQEVYAATTIVSNVTVNSLDEDNGHAGKTFATFVINGTQTSPTELESCNYKGIYSSNPDYKAMLKMAFVLDSNVRFLFDKTSDGTCIPIKMTIS
jgi:hypothetical protein